MNTYIIEWLRGDGYEWLRAVSSAAAGWAVAALQPALPYMAACTAAVALDCASARALAARVARKRPSEARPRGSRLHSAGIGRTLSTLARSYALIAMACIIDSCITDALHISTARMAAGAICFWQLWSVLENESSCNDAPWARMAQRILIDKTERHLDIDLSELRHRDNNEKD